MATAFHFKTDDKKQYHLQPIDFVLQSLLVLKANTRIHLGDIIIEAKEMNGPYNIQFLKAWLADASLQTNNAAELQQTFAILLTDIAQDTEDRIHVGLAQTTTYLGKVRATQINTMGTLHNILYDLSLPHFGAIKNDQFILNFYEKDQGDYDKAMLDRIENLGFNTRLAKFEELF